MAGEPIPYRILGPLTVLVDGREVSVGGQKPKAVLIRLLLEPGTLVSFDTLVEAVWEDQAPADAVKNIQVYVARMRKLLPEGLIASGPTGYLVACERGEIDAVRYQELVTEARQAVADAAHELALDRFRDAEALWRGDALADVRYATFAHAPIAFFEQLRLTARDEEVALRLLLGQGAELLPELERLVRDEPLRERRWGHLMVAHYQSGDQTEALRTFDRLRATFVEEMGLDPSPEMRRLQQRILDHDPELMGRPTTAPAMSVQAASAPHPTSDELVAAAADRSGGRTRIVAHGNPCDALEAAGAAPELVGGGRVVVARPLDGKREVAALFGIARDGEVIVSQAAHTSLLAHGADPLRFAPVGWLELGAAGARAVYKCRPNDQKPAARSRSTAARRGVLPAYRNAFLGRTGELQAIGDVLTETGAVTLLGPGGIGKTRLAVEFATQARDRYSDGAWLVDLAGAHEHGALVWNAVCETLALDVGRPSASSIADALAERSILLVLDTCEQVTAAVTELVEMLASRADGVATIVTSRTRTGYRGERILAVEPLGWSGDETAAVGLALSRAAEAGVVVEAEALIANVCAAASGMPLAIELAVAQLAHLTVPELLARMDDQPNLLLADSSATRHASIRAAFATSLDLLSDPAHDVLLTSAAFRGSFALGDVTAVHGADAEPAARELVAASLWSSAAAGAEMRFSQLEPVRQFTYARLVESGRDREVHARHAEYFVALVRDEAIGLRRAVDPDIVSANLAAAHDWARTHGHHDLAARVATAMLSAPAMLHAMVGGATLPASSLGGIA